LPNQDATPDEKTPVEGEPRPELAVTTPTEVFERLETPALRNEQAQKLVDPDDPGLSTIIISGRASGVEEAIQGGPGPDNEDSQDEIRIAEGNPDAERTAAKGEEVRDGVLENGVESTEGNDDTGLISTQLASLQESDEFRAPDKGPRDQPAIATGELTPLAKIIAAIAGKNEALARALTNPKPLDTVGGIPDPGDLKTNDVLEKAADAGLAQAQTKLAQRYIIGLAIGATPDKVAELLRNAAERGDQEAQLLLGALFADGRIVPKDLVQSHVFFELASAQGNDEANEMLPVLERQMTPREVVDSRRLARQYKRLLDSIAAARTLGSRGDGQRDQLLQASAAGNTAKIAELLSRGADLEGDDTAGRTAVINAAWRGEQEVVDLLVELDADLNVADHDGRTAVSWAASNGHADIVRKLLLSGARPAIDDKEGLTPLMRAAWNGHEDVVRLLVDAGSTLSATDDVGKSPGFCGRLECKPLPQFDLMRE
jgi:TPR repeat protein